VLPGGVPRETPEAAWTYGAHPGPTTMFPNVQTPAGPTWGAPVQLSSFLIPRALIVSSKVISGDARGINCGYTTITGRGSLLVEYNETECWPIPQAFLEHSLGVLSSGRERAHGPD
jgi:hypothetical protein